MQHNIQDTNKNQNKGKNKNKFNSKKFFLAIAILIMGFIPMILKLYNIMFIQFFKEWCWLAIGVFAVYTGGNIGEKISRKNHNITNSNNQGI